MVQRRPVLFATLAVLVMQVLLNLAWPAGECAAPLPPPRPPPSPRGDPPPSEPVISRKEACALIGGCRLRPQRDSAPTDPDTSPMLYFMDYLFVTQEALVDYYMRKPEGGVFLDAGAGIVDAAGLGNVDRSRYAGVYEYHRLDARPAGAVANGAAQYVTCDLHDCASVADDTYDIIYLKAVYEHLAEPWRATQEIARMLKPGGIVINVCFMATRWHTSEMPYGTFGDHYRFTHNAMMHLHEGVAGMKTLDVGYDIRGRRMPKLDIQRRDENHWDWAPRDDLGAWMEIWTIYFVGEKPAAADPAVRCGCDYCNWKRGGPGQAAMRVPHKYSNFPPYPKSKSKPKTPRYKTLL